VVNDRLAYLLGQQQPRRAASQLGGARSREAHEEPEETEVVAQDQLQSPDGDGGFRYQRRFSRLHVAVVCLLLALGLVLAAAALLRARPVAIATPQATVSIAASQPAVTPDGAGSNSSPAPQIVVHVLGAVRRPGLVHLPERSRVSDAIEAAGGLRGSASPGELNLAQTLSDGQQILIGSAGKPGGEVRDGGGGAPEGNANSGSSGQLDLNAATAAQLDTLPGVGPVTAERILSWRADHGRFRRIEELQEVEGIGPKTYAQIAPHVRL